MFETTQSNIINVHFHSPVNGKTDYFFGSLKAIYTMFSPEEIGCKLSTLYSSRLVPGRQKVTETCVITKCRVYRLRREQK